MGLSVEVLRESFALVVEREDQVTARFYGVLFERYPQVQPLFAKNRPEVQQKMLQEALVAVLEHLEDGAWLTETLGNLGAGHVDYGVTEPMYDWVGESLLAALSEIAAEAWTPEVEAAWVEAYGAIKGLMLAGAERRLAENAAN